MSVAKECIVAHEKQKKIDEIRELKKEVFKDLLSLLKRLESKTSILENMLMTEDLKKEILDERKTQKKTTSPSTKKPVAEPKKEVSFSTKDAKEDVEQFEYTLEQIEKKLAELRKS